MQKSQVKRSLILLPKPCCKNQKIFNKLPVPFMIARGIKVEFMLSLVTSTVLFFQKKRKIDIPKLFAISGFRWIN